MDNVDLTIGLLGVAGAVLCIAMAALVYGMAPSRRQNRLVALLLFFAGLEVGSTFGIGNLNDWDVGTLRGLSAVNAVTWLVEPWLYLALLGTLASPLSAALRGPRVQRVLITIAAAMVPVWFVVGTRVLDNILFIGLALGFHAVVMLFGLVVAVSAWRRTTRGSSDRARARAFAVAFGARDLGTGVIGTFSAITAIVAGANLTPRPVFILVPLSVVLMALFMGYGIARVSLFDIDIKVKWTLKRGTLAGIFVAVFFVVSQLAQNFLSQTGGLVLGGVVTGLVLFAIHPLQRFAEGLSDKAMPKTGATPEYLAFRKMEVYKAAVEELAVGGVTAKERRALDALRGKLGIGVADAKAMEHDTVAARAVG